MRNINDCQPLVEHIQHEHRRLCEVVRQTQAALGECVHSRGDAREVAQRLVDLRNELFQHYAEEEQGGCMEEAECRCPRLAGEVKRITLEHEVLRSEMDRLVALAGSLPQSSEQVAELERAFRAFAARLHQHEAAENRIMAYAFGAEALDEFTEEPNHVDAGPCGCGSTSLDRGPGVTLEE